MSSCSSSSSESEGEGRKVTKIANRAKSAAQKAVHVKYKVQRALKAESQRDKTQAPVYYIETLAKLAERIADDTTEAATAAYSSLKHFDLDESLHAGGRAITLNVAEALSKCAMQQASAVVTAYEALLFALKHHHTELASLAK